MVIVRAPPLAISSNILRERGLTRSELTESSLKDNLADLGRRGLLGMDQAGIPKDARYRIESLFQEVARGELDPSELKSELDRRGLFPEYEDRFLDLFRKRW